MAEYVIKEVIPKSGKMLEIHEEVLGRRCYILALEKISEDLLSLNPVMTLADCTDCTHLP